MNNIFEILFEKNSKFAGKYSYGKLLLIYCKSIFMKQNHSFGKALFLMAIVSLFFATSCSSPASKGKGIAEDENNLYTNCAESLDKLNDDYSTNLDAAKYQSRRDAINEWKDSRKKIETRLVDGLSALEEELQEMSGALKPTEQRILQQAYYDNRNEQLQGDIRQRVSDTVVPKKVLLAISKIKPAKPDEKQILKDLSTKSFTDVEGGYFDAMHRVIDAKEYDIRNLKMIDVEKDNSSEYVVLVGFRLVGKNNKERCIDIKCNVRYILPDYDDWTIDFQQTTELTPVKNDTYINCVKTLVAGGWLGKDLYVENRCDKTLEVFVRSYEYGNWNKKIVVAKPQEKTFVDYGTPDESHIDFVLPL